MSTHREDLVEQEFPNAFFPQAINHCTAIHNEEAAIHASRKRNKKREGDGLRREHRYPTHEAVLQEGFTALVLIGPQRIHSVSQQTPSLHPLLFTGGHMNVVFSLFFSCDVHRAGKHIPFHFSSRSTLTWHFLKTNSPYGGGGKRTSARRGTRGSTHTRTQAHNRPLENMIHLRNISGYFSSLRKPRFFISKGIPHQREWIIYTTPHQQTRKTLEWKSKIFLTAGEADGGVDPGSVHAPPPAGC